MKLETVSEKKNPFLKRTEYTIMVEHEKNATPSRLELQELIAKHLNANKDLVIVDKIETLFGKAASQIKVKTYDKIEDISKEKLEKVKRRTEKKGAKLKEEQKTAQKEEPKEEEKKQKEEKK